MEAEKHILFEPWGLGDSLIAFAVALQRPETLSVVCQSRWHPILTEIASVQELVCPDLLSADLGYTSRDSERRSHAIDSISADQKGLSILSIRGDIRDYRAAKAMSPKANIIMRGWIAFAAKRSRLVDLPFKLKIVRVVNRYYAWARITGIPWKKMQDFFNYPPSFISDRNVVLHVGAQWRSKQYPHVAALASLLRRHAAVHIVAGPSDPLPPDVEEADVERLRDAELVRRLHSATEVIANDSGPMHVAALLRRRTLVITNHAAMQEWLPPNVLLLGANPRSGHRATHIRPSDEIFDGWPAATEVMAAMGFS